MTTTIDLAALLQVPIRKPLEKSQVKQILVSAPFIPIPHALNLRTISAPALQPNLVFRSGSLSHLPPSSLIQLNEKYNITTIVDLRSRKERESYPSPDIQGIETLWMPASGDGPVDIGAAQANAKQVLQGVSPADFAANDGIDGFVKTYGNMLDTHKDAFRVVFERLKEPQGGVLFHCTAGKDRTGILAALILGLINTPPEIISHDYALTRIGTETMRDQLLGAMIEQMSQQGIDNPFEVPGFEAICGAKGPTILAVMKWMDEKWSFEDQECKNNLLYPGVHGYLTRELGFSGKDLEKIKKSLAL